MTLLARVIGGDQMFTTIFDPFDGFFELQRGGADQHILGIYLTANTEAAADMALVKLDFFDVPSEHEREPVPVPVRHLGGAVHFEYILAFVVTCDCTTRFNRHAAVSPDREIKFDDRMRGTECGVNVAGFLFNYCRLGAPLFVERAR